MTFLLGSFTDGLFGGMRDMAQVADAWENLKVKRKQNAAGDAVEQAMKTSQPTDTSMPKGQQTDAMPASSSAPAPDKLPEPDLDSMPTPTFMNSPAMKSASAADAKAAAPAKTPTTTPPEYLSPAMKSATAADAQQAAIPTTAAAPTKAAGAAPGTMIWTPDKGLHPAQPGESGMSFSNAIGAVGNAFGGGVSYDPSKGIYSPGSVVGQTPAAPPPSSPPPPSNPGLAIFPSAIAGTPPAMQPSADLDFQQKRRENMFAIFPSQR